MTTAGRVEGWATALFEGGTERVGSAPERGQRNGLRGQGGRGSSRKGADGAQGHEEGRQHEEEGRRGKQPVEKAPERRPGRRVAVTVMGEDGQRRAKEREG